MKNYYFTEIPPSRIATFDVYAAGSLKHHVSALLEFDVTESRTKLSKLRKSGTKISFNAWLIKSISLALEKYPEAASFVVHKKKIITFKNHKISFLVEKQVGEKKVPLPMVLDQVNEKSAQEITHEIQNVKQKGAGKSDVVLDKRTRYYERLYYHLPAFLRGVFWRYMMTHPKTAYGKMGNVSITSLGMTGKIDGWFIHRSIHPLSFGIGSVIQKPAAVDGDIKIRDILNMTVLMDHDVIDGAPMVRFIKELKAVIENGTYLNA